MFEGEYNKDDRAHELRTELEAERKKCAELEAQAACMREALVYVKRWHDSDAHPDPCTVCRKVEEALSTDAGKSLLEKVAALEESDVNHHKLIEYATSQLKGQNDHSVFETIDNTKAQLEACRQRESCHKKALELLRSQINDYRQRENEAVKLLRYGRASVWNPVIQQDEWGQRRDALLEQMKSSP